jgi:hypothetical protein
LVLDEPQQADQQVLGTMLVVPKQQADFLPKDL